MSPQLEAVLMVTAATGAACTVAVTWAVVVTARSRGNWATAASHLATRITAEANERADLAARVTAVERATGTPTGPRLGVAPSRPAVRGGFPSEALSEALRVSRGKGAR